MGSDSVNKTTSTITSMMMIRHQQSVRSKVTFVAVTAVIIVLALHSRSASTDALVRELIQASSSSLCVSSLSTSSSNSATSTRLAYEQSFGLFDDVTDLMWHRIRERVLTNSWYWDPTNPLFKVDDAPWWHAHNMLPNFNCPHQERIGSKVHEGSKFVCNADRLVHENKPDCLIYSIGSAGDFKFEDAIAKMHNSKCEIHVFDPANWERKGDVENKNIHYHVWGFISTYDKESKSVVWPKGRGGGFKTFPDTLKELGHENRTIDIFKIDCEGCEYSTHKDWVTHDIRQIYLEVHGVPKPTGDSAARWYKKPMNVVNDYYQDFADNGFALFSRDPNGALGLELSFIKLHPDFWKTNENENAVAPA